MWPANAAYGAIDLAMQEVKNNTTRPIPTHLQDAHYKSAGKLGHGIGYEYAHDFPNHFSHQRYLPEGLEIGDFYKPGDLGYEKQIKDYLEYIRTH